MSLPSLAFEVASAVFLPLSTAGRKAQRVPCADAALGLELLLWKTALGERSHLWELTHSMQICCFQTAGFQNLTKTLRGVGSWGAVLQLMVSFFHAWKLRAVSHLQLMVELCLICCVYYDFIPHSLLAALTPSSLALFSHQSYSSEFPCSLPAVEQLGRYWKTQTALKGSEGHSLAMELLGWAAPAHPQQRWGCVWGALGCTQGAFCSLALATLPLWKLRCSHSRECCLFLGKQACFGRLISGSFYP